MIILAIALPLAALIFAGAGVVGIILYYFAAKRHPRLAPTNFLIED